MQKKYWVFSLLLSLALLADQITKVWARRALKPTREVITVVEGFFDFRYSENEGSAFGLFRGLPYARYLLVVVGIVARVVVLSFLRRARGDKLRVAGELGLLAGGAIGNIVDRVAFGRVTDFILWHVHQHEWPVFNIADAALVVGVIGLLIDMRGEDAQVVADRDAPTPDEAARSARAAGKRRG